MIKTKYYITRKDGVVLNKTFSDREMMIQNSEGVQYSIAIDPVELNRQYTETDIPIPDYEVTDKEFMNMVQGVM